MSHVGSREAAGDHGHRVVEPDRARFQHKCLRETGVCLCKKLLSQPETLGPLQVVGPCGHKRMRKVSLRRLSGSAF